MIRDIAGRQNHSIRLARKLQKKKHRRERGLLVCEGMDLLHAAVETGAQVSEVLVRRDLLPEIPASLLAQAGLDQVGESTVAVGICDVETLEYASSLGGGVDVIFMCPEPVWSLGGLAMTQRLTFFLGGVGDPGNVGTIIRSALAFGLAGVICAPGTADPYSPKAMRAGMGAQFDLPVVTEVSVADLLAKLESVSDKQGTGVQVWVADAHEGEDIRAVPLTGGTVVVLGAERGGAGSEWAGAQRVTIPQERFESINVAMAGTIFAYESYRSSAQWCSGK